MDFVKDLILGSGWTSIGEGKRDLKVFSSNPDPYSLSRPEEYVDSICNELASASQDTVSRSGVMLRFEAIRTEAHQNVYRPLEPYQNRDDIRRQGRYWQQIVTFFVRTRQDHSWKSPLYKFNRRQDRAFERTMAVARVTVNGADESSDT
jgi:hypothetical protein